MFAYLQQKAVGEKAESCNVVSWRKEKDLLVTGSVDGTVTLRNMQLPTQQGILSRTAYMTDTHKHEEQDLINHQMEIRNIAWNPQHDIVATGDIGGIVTVWQLDQASGIWENFMATRAAQVTVMGMEWSKDGECICIVYANGQIMVGKIDGMKLWSVELKHACIPAWSHSSVLLIGTSLGQVYIYDKESNNVGFVALTKKSDMNQPLVAIQYCPTLLDATSKLGSSTTPSLAVAFEDGKCFLLQDENDTNGTLIVLPLSISCMEWSVNGQHLAVGGQSKKTANKPVETAQIIIISNTARQEYSMRFDRYNRLTSLTWDGKGGRLALVMDNFLHFLTVKHPLKYCYFETILAYSCGKEGVSDCLLVLYNCKTERKVTVKHYPGQRILSLAAVSDFCVAATKVNYELGQHNIYMMNDIGATCNTTSVKIEPVFLTANENQVVAASREVIFVWSFRQSAHQLESGSSRWESNERYFHIDDAHGFIDVKLKKQRMFEISVDPICAITCSKDVLVVGRESGNVVRYSLPQMIWEREYSSFGLARPKKLGLNQDSSRLLVMSVDGECCLFTLMTETKQGRDAAASIQSDVKMNLERHDIWDFIWAEDDENMFIVAHKNTAVVYRNRHPEEPILNEGYFCQFKNLEIRVAFVEEMINVSTEPATQSSKVLRVKSLRETHSLIETSSLTEAQRFVDTHPHPVLWNLIADKALQQLQFDLAEVCYIHGENYKATQFIHRARKQKSDRARQAEVSAYFGDLFRAEQEFVEANRTDLAFDMRIIAGDWFRLKEMAEENENESALKRSYEGLGKYYFDRQSWSDAVANNLRARDYEALFQCYMIRGDVVELEELGDGLPAGHPLLKEIGRLLGRYGHSGAAAKFLKKADCPELALTACLMNYNFQTAAEIADTVDSDHTSGTITALMKKTIHEQISKNAGEETRALWDTGNLFYNAGSFLDAARCLFQALTVESERKGVDYLKMKKMSVLAASCVEEWRSKGKKKILPGTMNKVDNSSVVLEEDNDDSSSYAFLDDAWHPAEAYNLILVAQTFYRQSDYLQALRCAATLTFYTDVIDPVEIFSLIALISVKLKRWDLVNEAIMRLVNMDTTPSDVIQDMQHSADELFTKFSPNDVDKDAVLPSPLCMKCQERIPIWNVRCDKCGTKYPLCMATGSPVTEREVWQCDFCHHHCTASAIITRRACPLCHRAKR